MNDLWTHLLTAIAVAVVLCLAYKIGYNDGLRWANREIDRRLEEKEGETHVD